MTRRLTIKVCSLQTAKHSPSYLHAGVKANIWLSRPSEPETEEPDF